MGAQRELPRKRLLSDKDGDPVRDLLPVFLGGTPEDFRGKLVIDLVDNFVGDTQGLLPACSDFHLRDVHHLQQPAPVLTLRQA